LVCVNTPHSAKKLGAAVMAAVAADVVVISRDKNEEK
jgi:hypothetical protein